MTKKILIILHQSTSTPGRIGTLLENRGYKLDIRRPALGDQLPQSLKGKFDGAVMFGGPMSANDDEDFIKYEKDWIQIPLKENIPFVGICLGSLGISIISYIITNHSQLLDAKISNKRII